MILKYLLLYIVLPQFKMKDYFYYFCLGKNKNSITVRHHNVLNIKVWLFMIPILHCLVKVFCYINTQKIAK